MMLETQTNILNCRTRLSKIDRKPQHKSYYGQVFYTIVYECILQSEQKITLLPQGAKKGGEIRGLGA